MTAPLTPDERAALRDLDAKRTHGEWSYGSYPYDGIDSRPAYLVGPEEQEGCFAIEDAAYIAAACNALPRALAQIEALEAESARTVALLKPAIASVHEATAEIERLKAELQAMGARAADAKWDLTP